MNIKEKPHQRYTPRPDWLKVRLPQGKTSAKVRKILSDLELHTVCQSARCPNLGECWGAQTATFLIMGDVCTRNCTFCAIPNGLPQPLDPNEPQRVAKAAVRLGLKHVVITSVTRDDLPDGGARHFINTVYAVRWHLPEATIEILVPDFAGSSDALNTVLSTEPDILNHNLETVPSLYKEVRPGASFSQSLFLIQKSAEQGVTTKSGLMLGLGETIEEVRQVMKNLSNAGCQILTLGQYLQPSHAHHPVSRFYTPEEFESLKQEGLSCGFRHIESGPLVRSSYMAHRALST
jgi:lipoic acid synthetase